eukprot:1129505-Rhodomonas_salina.1
MADSGCVQGEEASATGAAAGTEEAAAGTEAAAAGMGAEEEVVEGSEAPPRHETGTGRAPAATPTCLPAR